jgi:UDP-glucose:(heptosyl)LPS alpha-1,3-glucosyltransferase
MASAEAKFYRQYRGRVIAVSRKVAGELANFYEWAGHAEIIPHGVDSKKFNNNHHELRTAGRKELGIGAQESVALYIGDLTKAHSYLKELAAALPEIRFVIITASRAYHWQSPNVQILPATPNLVRYYASADAFVFPSTYDSFGMVVLEAMASGLPVFCSDQAGAAEQIENAIDGFVTPLNDWTRETTEALRNLPQLTEIGRAARRSAEKRDWTSVVSQVERVYQDVAGI